MPKEINISDSKNVEKVEEKKVPVVKESPPIENIPNPVPEVENASAKESKPKMKEKLKKEKVKKVRKPMKKWVLISLIAGGVLVVLGGIFSFYYFGIFKFVKDPSDVASFPTDYLKPSSILTVTNDSPIALLLPERPRTEESPLNGELFTVAEMEVMMKRRPVAAMINNHSSARPQSGLNSADIVFEALVESGITRHMAIFWSEGPEKIGPIRSARNYYLQWLNPLDALYIHDGCALSDNPEANACGNIYNYGIKDLGTTGAWRWNDGVRFAPHNEYNSVVSAWDYASNLDWDEFPEVESWSFKRDANPELRGEGHDVEIAFHTAMNNGGAYDVKWTYDSDTNTYLRRVGGKLDIDQETGTQVWAKSVVIQEVTTAPAYDETARIVTDTIDEGDATFLIDGNVIEGTWEKKSRTDRTTYYDSDGKEIQFNRGRIWICAVSTNSGRFDIIEE